jgi:nucleoid DNA-binding protein
MRRPETMRRIGAACDVEAATVELVLSSVVDAVVKAIAVGELATIVGLGSFSAQKQAASFGWQYVKGGGNVKRRRGVTTKPKFKPYPDANAAMNAAVD